MSLKRSFEDVVAVIEKQACWQGGRGSEWECDAIVSPGFLEALAQLAAHAPSGAIERFCEEWSE